MYLLDVVVEVMAEAAAAAIRAGGQVARASNVVADLGLALLAPEHRNGGQSRGVGTQDGSQCRGGLLLMVHNHDHVMVLK